MPRYEYTGPVMRFERCVKDIWKAYTTAETPKKALSNLSYRYKKENNLQSSAQIKLPGKLKEVE